MWMSHVSQIAFTEGSFETEILENKNDQNDK